jgi:lysophospholipase L1-like esterase
VSKERSRNRAWLLAGLALAAGVGLATLLERPRVKLGKASRILLVGDSLAQGLAPHLGALAKDASYPFGAEYKVGSRIDYWAGARLAAALGEHAPSLVLVVLGTNDFAGGRSAAAVQKDAQALLDQLAQFPRSEDYGLGPDVLWVSPLAGMSQAHPAAAKALEDAVRGPSPSSGTVEYFDSTALDVRLGPDSVHPTAAGLASWAGALWKRIS